MMYDELVKRLRDAAKMSEALAVLLPHSEGNATAKLYNEAADAIEELTAQNRGTEEAVKVMQMEIDRLLASRTPKREADSKWIPVTERLPEDDGFYMCSVENKNKFIDIFRFDVDDGEFFIKDLGDVVTHWMPLPEPPKEDT